MSKKTTKKVRGSALRKGMTLATGERILTVGHRDIYGAAGTMPVSLMMLTLDGGSDGQGGVSATFGASEWVEIKKEA